MELDTIIRNGTVVTASDVWPCCDIGIKVYANYSLLVSIDVLMVNEKWIEWIHPRCWH